jgi:hypothetical protein
VSFSVFTLYSLIPLRYILYIYVFPSFPFSFFFSFFFGFSMDVLTFNHWKREKKNIMEQ